MLLRQNCTWSLPPMLRFALESAPGTHQVHSLQRKLHQCVSSGVPNANPDLVFQEDRAEAEPSKSSRTVSAALSPEAVPALIGAV